MNSTKNNTISSYESIEDLFVAFYSPLCNFAYKYISDAFIAEEIVQNLFIEIWEKKTLDTIEQPERYLMRSVKFKCIDFLRKKDPYLSEYDVSDIASDYPSELKEADIEPLLYYFAAKLPPKTREVFLLSRKSGLTYKEISEELQISPKTVENQMSRALRIMRDLLKENDYLALLILIEFLNLPN